MFHLSKPTNTRCLFSAKTDKQEFNQLIDQSQKSESNRFN